MVLQYSSDKLPDRFILFIEQALVSFSVMNKNVMVVVMDPQLM